MQISNQLNWVLHLYYVHMNEKFLQNYFVCCYLPSALLHVIRI